MAKVKKKTEETAEHPAVPTIETRHIDDLRAHPRNPRVHPESLISKLRKSIEEYGWTNPVLVTSDGIIIAGHARTKAARAMGLMNVPCIVLPLTGDKVDGYLIADNRLAEESEWDIGLLKDLIADLDTGAFDIELTGFDMAELDELFGGSFAGRGEETLEEKEELVSLFPVFSKEVIIDSAFEHFRNNPFQYPTMARHVALQAINRLASLDGDALFSTRSGCGVADPFHPHRFHQGTADKRPIFESWKDDRLLRLALEKVYTMGGNGIGEKYPSTLGIVHGTHVASNFRPGFALAMYRKFCPKDGVILDTSSGHGGRLVAFVAFGGEGRYIGIDPHTKAHEGNLALAKFLGVEGRVELVNLPAEDVPAKRFKGACDFAFTSPPYFSKEHYSKESTQSSERYPEPDQWRSGFLKKMIALQFGALKPGSFSVINIADVRVKNVSVPLSTWVVEDAKEAGFEYVETLMYPLSKAPGANVEFKENTKFQGKKAFEPAFVFRKPE